MAVQMRNALMRCGMTQVTADYVTLIQGYNSTAELLMASQDNLDTMVKNAIKSAPDGVVFSAVAIRKLNAFKHWIDERHMCGLSIQPNLFVAETLETYLRFLRSDEIEVAARKDQKPTKPDALKQEKEWFKFWEKFKNYLGQVRGAARVPLSYVVRDHEEVTLAIREAEYETHTRKVAALLLLSGEHYKVDNASVWEIVKSLVIDGFGWNFVKRFDKAMDGRAAIMALKRQCEGKTSINTRKNKAYLSITGSSYKGHRKAFTFAQYVAIHQAAHNELDDCNEPMPETKKVSDFIAGISDPSLDAGITCVLSDDRYGDDFESTQQFLGTLVANQAVHRQGKRGTTEDRKVASASGNTKGGNKGKSKDGKKKLEARFYSKAEWFKLTQDERNQVMELKKKAKEEGKASGKSAGKRKTAATNSSERDEEGSECEDAEANEPSTQGAGNEFGRGAHKKKKVTIASTTRFEPTRATQRNVLAVTTRRIMDTSNLAGVATDGSSGRVELDTHADTCVAGSNTVVLDMTGKVVSVSPFCDTEYQSIEDVPVATVATAYDCPVTGKVHILVINEALYFGERMNNTLLCPNQLRANGLQVQDCPRQYDASSRHSVYVPSSDLNIPLSMRGVISGFNTRLPTQAELDDLSTHVELTSDVEWDPYSVDFSEVEGSHDREWDERRASVTTSQHDVSDPEPLVEISLCERNDLADRLLASVRTDLPTLVPSHDVSAVVRGSSRTEITPEHLSRAWNIGLQTATRTLQVTTQMGVRAIRHPAQRRFRTAMPHLRYPRLMGTWYADTLFFSVKSIRQFKCAHLIGNGMGFSRFTPMETKADAHLSLDSFIKQHGITENLVVDGDPTMAYKDWKQTVREFRIKQTTTEPYSPWQNKAELDVREVKRGIRRFKRRTNSPRRLWCFLGELVSALRGYTAYESARLQGRCAAEHALGYTPDISPWVQHSWYDNVWYRDADGENKIGKWLGPAVGIGGGDCYWILPLSARPIARSTVWAITEEEFTVGAIKDSVKALDISITERIGDQLDNNAGVGDPLPANGDYFDDDEDDELDDVVDRPEAEDYTPETFDGYLTASVMLPRGGEVLRAQVVARKRDSSGNPIGRANSNPILDTREYEVEFEDGVREFYAANLIAENMYSQIDSEGNQHLLLSEIIDHAKDNRAMRLDDGTFVDKHGRTRPRITTQGWKLLVEWKNGMTSWVPLKEIKESFPIETAEYAVANKVSEEPAFKWWVEDTLRKRSRIIKKVKSAKYWKRTHKYGIRLPHSVEEALRIDEETGTDFWFKSIEKEMRNVMPAFEAREDDKMPIGYKLINCHMVFDVKIGDLTRKARFCANGNETDPPKESTFSTVVSRDTVRLFFLLAALNDLEILSADIQNAYLNAPVREKLYTIAGKEFGPKLEGRPLLIVRALYGLRSSGKAFRDYLASNMREMGYVSSKADPDLWMKPDTKSDGTEYYRYVICYVDDVAVTMEDPKEFMDALSKRFTLKEGSVQEPELYLGADVKKWYIAESDDPGKVRWALASTKYTKRAIADLEVELDSIGKRLPTKVTTPLTSGYRPELDQSAELNPERQNYFQGLIGVLRWVCELGRLDILMPVSMLSRYLVSARVGHLDQVFHTFAYLKRYETSTMVFDDTEPDYDERRFKECDWSEYYPDAKESLPKDMPQPRGKSVVMSCFVDADHAGCRVTRRSHTGVLIFINRAPIQWFSKRQNTVESSTFGSEFVAMRIAIEMIEGLRYKLRMMGVGIQGPCNLFCDNNAVVLNSSVPESMLKKKHAAINYHRAREAIAAGVIRVAKEDTATNIADLLTKCLPGPALREHSNRVLW